jgi:hypothetical protein
MSDENHRICCIDANLAASGPAVDTGWQEWDEVFFVAEQGIMSHGTLETPFWLFWCYINPSDYRDVEGQLGTCLERTTKHIANRTIRDARGVRSSAVKCTPIVGKTNTICYLFGVR